MIDQVPNLTSKFRSLKATFTERGRRLWAASEARSLGHGGIKIVASVTGLSRQTIERGVKELKRSEEAKIIDNETIPTTASRRSGGGRKRLTAKDATLLSDLDNLVDPVTRGHPESALRWTSKSLDKLATELQAMGHKVSERSVSKLLKDQGYSLQAMRKTKEGDSHEHRNGQFEHIARLVKEFQSSGDPVVSVDAKKKELVGTFANKGREYQPKGQPEAANTYDFPDKELGKVTPYGVYDLFHNVGWVSVGIDHDTAEFAVQTLRLWWKEMGQELYPNATRLLITSDGGGSNGSRVRLWKVAIQQFADELGMTIYCCHFPPGTSKWNKIEHRMFSYISINWRGRALASRQIIVEMIGATTTKAGLRIRSALDEGIYPVGKKVTDSEMEALNLKRDAFQPTWNYSLSPISDS